MNELRYTKIREVKDPDRGHPTDAGIDFFIPQFSESFLKDLEEKNDPGSFNIDPYSGVLSITQNRRLLVPSGIKLDIPEGTALVGFNKSGVGFRKGLHLISQIIDAGYQGELIFNFANFKDTAIEIEESSKIIQYILMPIFTPKLKSVDTVSELYTKETTRASGGFGSTGV